MEPYASVDDYKARYGAVDDEAVLYECLLDATRIIATALKRAGIVVDDQDEIYMSTLMQVCRSAASRAMSSAVSTVPFGATQYSQAAGGYTESYSLGNPYGEIYLTKSEKKMLGLLRMRIGFLMPKRSKDD